MSAAEQSPMTQEKLMDYIETCNKGDYKKAGSLYYAEDIIFEVSGGQRVEGRDNLVEFLEAVHPEGMKEIMKVTNVLIDGDKIAAEVDAEMTFSVDVPDFAFGPAKKGDFIVLKCGVFYKVRDGRLAHITIYMFAPGPPA